MPGSTLIVAALLGISGEAPVPDPPPRAPESHVPIASVALAATGVVGVAGGLFFGWRVHDIQSRIEHQSGLAINGVFQDQMDRGRRAETLQWVSYGVGAAALVSSAAVYLLTRPGRDAPVAAVTATPLGAGVVVEGRF
jgi:hypothetical protein